MQPYDPQSVPQEKNAAQMDRQSVLCLLLILLLAAGLYYALTQTREKNIRLERAELITAQITQFPAVARAGVARLVKSGVPVYRIDFSPEAKGPRALFSAQGGGVRYQLPPAGLIEDKAYWRFKTVTDDNEGWFIAGLGQDTAEGKDVFAYLAGLPLSLCERVNRAHGLPAAPKSEAVTIDLATPAGPDVAAGLNAWTFAAHGKPVDAAGGIGQTPTAACVRNGETGNYIYYYLLAAQ